MTLTFAEICQALYDLLGLTEETAMVKRMVNEAMAEILAYRDWTWQITQSAVSFTGGQNNYAAPADCLKILNIQDANGAPLQFVNLQAFNELYRPDATSTGTPQVYTVQGADSVGVLQYRVWPLQSVTYSGAYIRYYRKVTKLVNDADVPSMPADFHFAIVKGAEARYRAWENNELAPQTKAEFDAILARLAGKDGGGSE